MHTIYNIFIHLAGLILRIVAKFNPKINLFVKGRQKVYEQLDAQIDPNSNYIWFHAASLGEFEQAVPVMEMTKELYPNHRILVTFFSPSGYENKKNHPLADVITYLPLDTIGNAQRFLDIANPTMVFFIKYDIWPNFLKELKQRNISTFLVSGAFRRNQIFFKSYGSFMKSALNTFEHVFVQNKSSKELLNSYGFENVSFSGDTRFDRVSKQISYNNQLDFIDAFIKTDLCIVAGSTWPEDDNLLIPYINSAPKRVKFIIAPHEIKQEKIENLRKKLQKKTILFSEKDKPSTAGEPQVFIIDTIGLLTKIYSYADIAYVGGAAGTTGLHNILEPATFGVPIVIGENFEKFPEAKQLQKLAGLFSVSNTEEMANIFDKLIKEKNFREKTGFIAGHFINSNTGATETIKEYLENRNL